MNILDCVAVVEKVRSLPMVDSESIVIFGGSCGGALGMETIARTRVAAFVGGEMSPHLFTGMSRKYLSQGIKKSELKSRGNNLRKK